MRTEQSVREHAASLYTTHYRLLWSVASRKFGVPTTDVPELIQDVMISFLANSTTIRSPEKWLVGAICNASRRYWRQRSQDDVFQDEPDAAETIPSSYQSPDDRMANGLTAAIVLDQISPRCRETLRLHYYEGFSAPELASAFSTTRRYAEYLIHKCLRRALHVFQLLDKGLPS